MQEIERIAILNGIVMGAGVGIMWHSQVKIATEATMYAMPETTIGFFPDNGASYFLSRINNNDISLGLFVALTGFRVKGEDLIKFGLATHFVKDENLDSLQTTLKKMIVT